MCSSLKKRLPNGLIKTKFMQFRKYRLLSYQSEPYQALNAQGWGYILTIEVWDFWGLRKRIVTKVEICPFSVDADAFWKPKLNEWLPKKKNA